MGSLHNDLHSWAARARANGQKTIEIDLETADKIVEILLDKEPIRVRCIDQLGNIAYITKDGRGVSCVLANGIPAGLSYAVGYCPDEVGAKLKIRAARNADEVLEVVRTLAGPTRKVGLV